MNNAQAIQASRLRHGIVGTAAGLERAISRAIKVAPIDLSVLIEGESGTGKEFFPQIIHENSPRKHSRYIAVNCGAIPEGTIDSELFGHEKGAFTGALVTRKGYFEEADGGTIFLDEVAELPLTTQARLLRVLESGEFIKVGSSTVQKANVRIVAATNADMARAVAEGRFREDLFYRLSTVTITVPPLRDRGSDVGLLARKFASDFSKKYMTPPVMMTAGAQRELEKQRWPGNVRQLKNVIEQLALFEAGKEIEADTVKQYLPEVPSLSPAVIQDDQLHTYASERQAIFGTILALKNEITELRAQISGAKNEKDEDFSLAPHRLLPASQPPVASCEPRNEPMTLEQSEKCLIKASLERHHGSRAAVAKELGIAERTLYRKIKDYGLGS